MGTLTNICETSNQHLDEKFVSKVLFQFINQGIADVFIFSQISYHSMHRYIVLTFARTSLL